MQLRGRLVLLFFVILFIASPVQGITPHEHFENTDKDLYAIIAFLADTKVLCEESLEYSLFGNCTINLDEIIELSYSQENLELSVEKSKELEDKLSYSSDILKNLKDKAGSYHYLKDFLYPIRALGGNVSSFVTNHFQIVMNFTKTVDFISNGSNETKALYALADVCSNITKCRSNLNSIEINLDEINQSFSTVILRNMIPSLFFMLDKYENYLDSLVSFLTIEEPTLLLYVEKNQVYLGEAVHAYGYFIADKAFVKNQTINIYWNENIINTTFTDNFGRYDVVILISLDQDLGVHNLTTSTVYNNTVYNSNMVLITVKEIPTRITLSVPKNDYYLNETIIFSGRLVDYKNRGITANVSLNFAGFNISLMSDNNRNFTYVFNHTLSFGTYSAVASFNPRNIYEKCRSKTINISINTPTFLTLFLSKNNSLHVREEIKLHGWLTSSINDSPLPYKTIEIFLNDKKIGISKTDYQGFYSFTHSTDDLKEGRYILYARFISDDVEWRGSSSEVIELQLLKDFTWSLMLYIAFITIVIFSTLVLLYFRKKLTRIFKKEEPSLVATTGHTPIVSQYPSEKIEIDVNDFTIDASSVKHGTDGFRDAIISKYQTLLHFLSSRGMMFNLGITHLDIRRRMLKEGFSRRATNVVTKAFEYAMYSEYPLDEKDITLFNKHIIIILKNAGG